MRVPAAAVRAVGVVAWRATAAQANIVRTRSPHGQLWWTRGGSTERPTSSPPNFNRLATGFCGKKSSLALVLTAQVCLGQGPSNVPSFLPVVEQCHKLLRPGNPAECPACSAPLGFWSLSEHSKKFAVNRNRRQKTRNLAVLTATHVLNSLLAFISAILAFHKRT